MNKKEKILIASFFSMILCITPFTVLAGSIDSTKIQTNEKTTSSNYYEIDYTKVKLTEDKLIQIQSFVNNLKDEESKTIAKNIFARIITKNGELNLLELNKLCVEYQNGGAVLGGTLLKQIFQKIMGYIYEFIWQYIYQNLMHDYRENRSGWVKPSVRFMINITYNYNRVMAIPQAIQGAIEDVFDLMDCFRDFINCPDGFTALNLLVILIQKIQATWNSILDVIDIINGYPDNIKKPISELFENVTSFSEWLLPDQFLTGYTIYDRPYNKAVNLKVQILGIEPDDMENVEISVDDHTYIPSDDGLLNVVYNTSNKAYPCWFHETTVTATHIINEEDAITVTYPDNSFSMGSIDITIDFSGRPEKPYGPTELKRLERGFYFTRAINPSGADVIYYQWDWGEYLADWTVLSRNSGYFIEEPHTWLTLGTHNVKVRAGDTPDGSGWVSEWSEILPVTVYSIIDFPASQSQPYSQPYSQPISNTNLVLINEVLNQLNTMVYGQSNTNPN